MGHPQPSNFETQTNATFDALMWALSRPGLARDLPEPGMALLVDALIDRECRVFASAPELASRAARSGAEMVEVEAADHVFLDSLDDVSVVERLALGSDLYPETGATLVAPAKFSDGASMRLTGPGIDGAMDVSVSGVPSEFWTRRRAVMRYPMGFELFLIERDRVLGLPRTTEVELL